MAAAMVEVRNNVPAKFEDLQMIPLTRKQFLKLSIGAVAAAASGGLSAASRERFLQPLRNAPVKTLIRGADLVTMDGELGEVMAADVLIDGGRIVAIGKDLEPRGAEIFDARGMVLMPGMVDGHRHVWQVLQAGELVHTQPARFATYHTFKQKVMVCLSAEDHYLAGLIGGLQAIDSGVTTLLDYADVQYTEDRALGAARGLKDSGINGWFAYQVSHSPAYGPGATVPNSQAQAAQSAMADEAHFKIAAALKREVFADGKAPLQLALCMSEGAWGAPMTEVKAELERMRALGVGLIAARSRRPAKPFPVGHFGSMDSGIPDLAAAGLLRSDMHFSHGNDLTVEELSYLKENGATLCSTVLDEFAYKMSGQRASVHGRARAAGVPVGLGLGNAVALTQDYMEHVRAAYWSLQLEPDSEAIAGEYTSPDTLSFATRLGARALRLGDETGTLTVGKRADLVLLRADRFGFGTMGSVTDRVVNFTSLRDVDSVWVAGKLMKTGGKLVGVDMAKLKSRLRGAQQRIAAAMQTIQFT